MPSRKMRTAIYFFYGLDVEIRPKMDPPELFIHLGGAIGYQNRPVQPDPSAILQTNIIFCIFFCFN